MKPYIVDKTFDLSRLLDSEQRELFDSDNRPLYVLPTNPSLPTNNGVGYLGDTMSCRVYYELNGQDELTMTYPVTGELFDQIELRAVLMVEVGRRGIQPYRIYRITKPINGVVTIYARHLAYDLAGIVVEPFTAPDIVSALQGLKSHAMTANPFNFATSRSTSVGWKVTKPDSIWALMAGQEGSLLDTYGGEYTFDGYTVWLENEVGADNGVSVVYGVNMTDLEQDASCADCFTGVVAYWQSEGDEENADELIYTPVISAAGTYGYVKILSVDMSERWENKPTMEQLKAAASAYIVQNKIGVPQVSWKINYVPLDITEEYKDIAALERVSMGDTVTVQFPKLGVDASARVRAIDWNVLLDRYESVELGDVRSNIADTIAKQADELEKVPTTKQVQDLATKISTTLTNAILGANGGSVRLLDTNDDGEPDTLYIADNPDPTLAKKVWRFNYEGWGASRNGYNGPFTLGATLDDGLLATFVTAANLVAGHIRSADGTTFYLDLDNGVLSMNGYASKTELATSGGTVINGGNISTGTMTADRIRGGTMRIGGVNDRDGIIDVYDGDGNWCGRISNAGLWMGGGSEGSASVKLSSSGLSVREKKQQGQSSGYLSIASIFSAQASSGKRVGALQLRTLDSSDNQKLGFSVDANGAMVLYAPTSQSEGIFFSPENERLYCLKNGHTVFGIEYGNGQIKINPNNSSGEPILIDGGNRKITLNPGNAMDSIILDGANKKITLNASQLHDAVTIEVGYNNQGKITLRDVAGNDNIVLDGASGRIDCKSLYINGTPISTT